MGNGDQIARKRYLMHDFRLPNDIKRISQCTVIVITVYDIFTQFYNRTNYSNQKTS